VASVLDVAGIQPDTKQPEPGGVALAIPVRVVNIPALETAAPEIVELTFETPAGRRWSSGWMAAASVDKVFQEDPAPDRTFAWRQRVVVNRDFWQAPRSGRVTIRGAVYVKIFGRRDVRLKDDGVTPVPGDGRCFVSCMSSPIPTIRRIVQCIAPFHMPATEMDPPLGTLTAKSDLQPASLMSIWDSPLPADFGMNPLSFQPFFPDSRRYSTCVTSRAYIRRTFEAPNVHLPL
jgi:hypothetical protein